MPLNFKKNYYGLNEAKENLDLEFSEFLPKSLSPKYFFELYENYFYNLPNSLHKKFIDQSIKYAYPEGWVNPRQIENTNNQIDSIEKKHAFFKNGTILMNIIYQDNPQPAIIEGNAYYMHSRKKRQILNNTVYQNLKNKIRKRLDQNEGIIEDSNFITFIDIQALNGIPMGPVIEKTTDAYISILEVNRYGRAPEATTLINRY